MCGPGWDGVPVYGWVGMESRSTEGRDGVPVYGLGWDGVPVYGLGWDGVPVYGWVGTESRPGTGWVPTCEDVRPASDELNRAMKLKCLPTDFQVEELTSVVPRNGPFALYELRKQSLGTLEAVQAIAQRWRIAPADISFGGLKDKHAVTCQYLTVAEGPRRNLRQTNLELTYLGQVPAV